MPRQGVKTTFGKKKNQEKDQRQRGREAAAAVFAYMDAKEAASWEWRKVADVEGDDVANERIPPPNDPIETIIADLLPMCGNDPGDLGDALEVWWQSREERYEDDEGRTGHVSGMYMSIALNGIGNLFGFVPEGAPSFNADLAARGRARGWRR